jgi:hypothetical protein
VDAATRARVELERRAAEINQTRDLFERVVESMSEACSCSIAWVTSAGQSCGGRADTTQ